MHQSSDLTENNETESPVACAEHAPRPPPHAMVLLTLTYKRGWWPAVAYLAILSCRYRAHVARHLFLVQAFSYIHSNIVQRDQARPEQGSGVESGETLSLQPGTYSISQSLPQGGVRPWICVLKTTTNRLWLRIRHTHCTAFRLGRPARKTVSTGR